MKPDEHFNQAMRRSRLGVAHGGHDAFAPRTSGLPLGTFRSTAWPLRLWRALSVPTKIGLCAALIYAVAFFVLSLGGGK